MGQEELNVARIRNTLDLLDLKVTALNRGFIMLLNVLQDRKILDENTVTWIDKIKRDPVLAKAIDNENLIDKALEIIAEVSCPQETEKAISTLKNFKAKPKITKIKLPKL